jgi:hypothetical protein
LDSLRNASTSSPLILNAVVGDALSPDFPLGLELEVFIRREDAERLIEKVRGDGPELAANLRIEERELEAGGRNSSTQSPLTFTIPSSMPSGSPAMRPRSRCESSACVTLFGSAPGWVAW